MSSVQCERLLIGHFAKICEIIGTVTYFEKKLIDTVVKVPAIF